MLNNYLIFNKIQQCHNLCYPHSYPQTFPLLSQCYIKRKLFSVKLQDCLRVNFFFPENAFFKMP